MFAFQLGREFKLSIAEILSVFPEGKNVYFDKEILILDFTSPQPSPLEGEGAGIKLELNKKIILEKAENLGGTIKIIEIIEKLQNNNTSVSVGEVISNIAKNHEGKFKYGISVFGENLNIKSILNNTKKALKDNFISSRFINKDFENLSSAQILGEKLINKNSDFNIINSGDCIYLGTSIWVQDINNYSKRDWQKDRDMNVGMLPPKLAQIMINLSGGNVIYDPFIGLGTVLIESVLMGNKIVYGSDLSDRMVEISRNNIINIIKKIHPSPPLSKEGENKENIINIFKQNAKYINEVNIFNENIVDAIVTEGYLGEMMTQKNISPERIEKQKIALLDLYEGFFSGLTKLKFKGNIVISFPFWEIAGKYFYFTEIYDTIYKYCNIQKLFPSELELSETKSGSLLYKRDKQLVGREIFKLKIK